MAWFSARRGSGGGGKVGEKGEGTESHLWVSLVRGEEVLGNGSTCAGGGTAPRRRRSSDLGRWWKDWGEPVKVEEAR